MRLAFLITIVLCISTSHVLLAQNQNTATPVPSVWFPNDYSWTTRAWSQNDDSYATISREVEAYLKQNPRNRSYIKQLGQGVSEKSSALQRYKYAYANIYYYRLTPASDYNEKRASLSKSLRILSANPAPANKYADLARFITQMEYLPKTELLPIAERLYKDEPQNMLVAHHYTYLLRGTFSVSNLQKALKIRTSILDSHPELPNAFVGVGLVYWDLWGCTHQADYADQAISHLESYLSRAPAGDSFRPEATRIIGVIKASKERWLSKHPSVSP